MIGGSIGALMREGLGSSYYLLWTTTIRNTYCRAGIKARLSVRLISKVAEESRGTNDIRKPRDDRGTLKAI